MGEENIPKTFTGVPCCTKKAMPRSEQTISRRAQPIPASTPHSTQSKINYYCSRGQYRPALHYLRDPSASMRAEGKWIIREKIPRYFAESDSSLLIQAIKSFFSIFITRNRLLFLQLKHLMNKDTSQFSYKHFRTTRPTNKIKTHNDKLFWWKSYCSIRLEPDPKRLKRVHFEATFQVKQQLCW